MERMDSRSLDVVKAGEYSDFKTPTSGVGWSRDGSTAGLDLGLLMQMSPFELMLGW